MFGAALNNKHMVIYISNKLSNNIYKLHSSIAITAKLPPTVNPFFSLSVIILVLIFDNNYTHIYTNVKYKVNKRIIGQEKRKLFSFVLLTFQKFLLIVIYYSYIIILLLKKMIYKEY